MLTSHFALPLCYNPSIDQPVVVIELRNVNQHRIAGHKLSVKVVVGIETQAGGVIR